MNNKVYIIIAMGVFIVFSSVMSFAYTIKDDIASGKIPLPSDAKPFQGPSMRMTSSRGDISAYTTSLNEKQLIRFYSKELAKRGWQTSDTLSDLVKKYKVPLKDTTAQGKKIDIGSILKSTYYFKKDNQTLMVMITPSRSIRQQETLLSLAYIGSAASQGVNLKQRGSLPDSIPQYNNAQLITSIGNSFIYSTPDGIQSVVYFYKQNMAAYGWELQNEVPLGERQIQLSGDILRKYQDSAWSCKNCGQPEQGAMPANYAAMLQRGITVLSGSYRFTRGKERCMISVSSMENELIPAATQIQINYRR